MLTILASAGYVARVAVTAAAPGMMHDFGLTQAQNGDGIQRLPARLHTLPYSFRHVSRLPESTLAFHLLLLGWTVLSALSACVGWRGFAVGLLLPQLWIIRSVLGVLSAPIYPTAVRLVAVTTPSGLQARGSGLVLASVGIGSAITPLVLAPITTGWGWRAALLFASTFSAGLLRVVVDPSRRGGSRRNVR